MQINGRNRIFQVFQVQLHPLPDAIDIAKYEFINIPHPDSDRNLSRMVIADLEFFGNRKESLPFFQNISPF